MSRADRTHPSSLFISIVLAVPFAMNLAQAQVPSVPGQDPSEETAQDPSRGQAPQGHPPLPGQAPSRRQQLQQQPPQQGLPPGGEAQQQVLKIVPTAQADHQWACQPFQLSEKGEKGNALTEELTVGQKFLLSCEGSPVQLKREALHFELTEERRWALRLLETKSLTESTAEFVVTTWVVGQMKFENVNFTDGSLRIGTGDFSIASTSVITPENNPEQKPFPPSGPATLAWPLYLWGFIGALALIGLAALVLAILQSVRRKRLLVELEKNATPLSPYNQFNKDLRRISRQLPQRVDAQWPVESANHYFGELKTAFRWFLARELRVPAQKTKPRALLKEIKRADPQLHAEAKKDLVLALIELDKAEEAKTKVSMEDAQQLSELCRKLADSIAKARSS